MLNQQCVDGCVTQCNETAPEDPSLFRRNWYSLASSTIMYTIWAAYTCLFVIGCLLFYWSKRIQPIKSRSPGMVLLSAVGGYLLVTNYAMAHYVTGINRWPCPFSHWSLFLAFPLFLFPFPVRALQLYLVFKRNVDKVKHHTKLQAKTAQRVTVVEQRFSMAVNGNKGGTDVERAIEHHKQKKAQQKKASQKKTANVIVEADDDGGIDNPMNVHGGDGKNSPQLNSPEPESRDDQVLQESSGVKKLWGLITGKKEEKKKANRRATRRTLRFPEGGVDESGIINTHTNRSLLERHINHLFTGLILLCFLVGMIRQFIPSLGLGAECVGCMVSLSSAIVQVIIIFIVLGVQGLSSIFIHTSQIKDQFKIGRELQLMTVLWMGMLVPACILSLRGTACEELRTELSSCSTFDSFTSFCYYNFAAQHWLIVGCVVVTFFITVLLPVGVTYHKGRKKLLNEPVRIKWPESSLHSLKQCLADNDACDAFQKFCVQSFCVEQILFWKDVEQFRQVADHNELRVRAVALYKRYIDASGNLFLQLPEDIQEELDNILAEAAEREDEEAEYDYNFTVERDVFSHAQAEIFRQMEEDTFPAFVQSDAAKKLILQWNTQAASLQALQEQKLL